MKFQMTYLNAGLLGIQRSLGLELVLNHSTILHTTLVS